MQWKKMFKEKKPEKEDNAQKVDSDPRNDVASIVSNNDDFLRSPPKIAAGMIKKIHETLIHKDDTYVSRKVKRKLVTKSSVDDKPEYKDRRSKIQKIGEGMKENYWVVKKDDKIAKTRNSPKVICKMISSLSQEQLKWVRDAGFGSLLHFDLGKLPEKLAFKVLEAFDAASCILKLPNGDIKITEREVYDVLGLPYEGDDVVIAQDDAIHERIIKWRAQFPISDGQSLVKASEVVDRMKQVRNADELFKMNFLIIITNVLIRSNTNNFVSQTILSFDDELDNCARYNWAAYLIKNLVITKERWMHTTSLYYTGPMIFLFKLYIDRVLYKGQKLVRRDKPALRGWIKGKLKKREAMESKSGAFGSGVQEIGENQRITEDEEKDDEENEKIQLQQNQDGGNPNSKLHEDRLERLSVKAALLIDAKRHYDSELSNAKNMHPNNNKILEIESKIKALFQTNHHNNHHVDNKCHMDQRGIYGLRCDAAPVESDFQKEANISQVSHVINKTVQPLSMNDSPGSYSQTPRIEPMFCKKTECVDISSDSSTESGYLGSSPGFDLEGDFSPATQKVYARRQSKKYQTGIYSLRCDATPIESDFQKEANISQEVSQLITKTVRPLFSYDSPSSYTQTPRSVSDEMVGFFKQLEEQIQENKFNVFRVLPPQIQLDEQIILGYEKVLKKYLSGRLLDLANDSNLQDFNKVLHFLLACRRIPSHLQQGFLTLRWDLPNLTSRAYELHEEVNRSMVMPLARSKERGELKSILGKYRQVEINLVNLEKEKDANLSVIARLQIRNTCLNEEVTNLKAEVAKNVVDGCGKLCNGKLGKLEVKDQISDEIIRLQASNEAIDAKIIKFADEAKVLHKDAAAQNYKVINLEALGAVYEDNVHNAMDSLVTMELKWKERVESLDY